MGIGFIWKKIREGNIRIDLVMEEMIVRNHNGAPMGTIDNGHIFHPREGWTPGFSSYELREIAKAIEKLDKM